MCGLAAEMAPATNCARNPVMPASSKLPRVMLVGRNSTATDPVPLPAS